MSFLPGCFALCILIRDDSDVVKTPKQRLKGFLLVKPKVAAFPT